MTGNGPEHDFYQVLRMSLLNLWMPGYCSGFPEIFIL